jgi:hypothetical protein
MNSQLIRGPGRERDLENLTFDVVILLPPAFLAEYRAGRRLILALPTQAIENKGMVNIDTLI